VVHKWTSFVNEREASWQGDQIWQNIFAQKNATEFEQILSTQTNANLVSLLTKSEDFAS
jgi:hypothetical protein